MQQKEQKGLYMYLNALRRGKAIAFARVRGKGNYEALRGEVYFLAAGEETLVVADFEGLPRAAEGTTHCGGGVHGFHIHAGDACSGSAEAPYSNANGHLNPAECAHPHHAGDLPPLFENNGCAFMITATKRFRPEEVIGRTVIVHEGPDDFRSQPSGNAGAMIACGEIKSAADMRRGGI